MSKARKQRAVARALRTAARELARDAALLEQRAHEAEAVADHFERLAELPEALAAHWTEALKRDRSLRLWQRDRELLRLAWSGRLTNAELGARFHLHEKSVSRILSARLRRSAKRPVADLAPALDRPAESLMIEQRKDPDP